MSIRAIWTSIKISLSVIIANEPDSLSDDEEAAIVMSKQMVDFSLKYKFPHV